MSTLFPKTITYVQRTATLSDGVWSETETSSTFVGSVQPVSGKDTQFLPEGRRDTGLVKVYSNTALSVSIEGENKPGDIVIWCGKKWEIIQELSYQNDLINHYKYLAAYIGEVSASEGE